VACRQMRSARQGWAAATFRALAARRTEWRGTVKPGRRVADPWNCSLKPVPDPAVRLVPETGLPGEALRSCFTHLAAVRELGEGAVVVTRTDDVHDVRRLLSPCRAARLLVLVTDRCPSGVVVAVLAAGGAVCAAPTRRRCTLTCWRWCAGSPSATTRRGRSRLGPRGGRPMTLLEPDAVDVPTVRVACAAVASVSCAPRPPAGRCRRWSSSRHRSRRRRAAVPAAALRLQRLLGRDGAASSWSGLLRCLSCSGASCNGHFAPSPRSSCADPAVSRACS